MLAEKQRQQLFFASCSVLLVTSLSFGTHAGVPGRLGTEFNFDASQLGTIVINITLIIPIILTVAFGGLFIYMLNRKTNPELKLSSAAH